MLALNLLDKKVIWHSLKKHTFKSYFKQISLENGFYEGQNVKNKKKLFCTIAFYFFKMLTCMCIRINMSHKICRSKTHELAIVNMITVVFRQLR